MAPVAEARTGPATITYVTPGRTYRVLGLRMRYLGEGVSHGHWFEYLEGRSGLESYSDPFLQELLATARITPVGPELPPAA